MDGPAIPSKPRTEELERKRASRDEIAERIARHVAGEGKIEAAPGLFLYRHLTPIGPLYAVSEPCFCIIVQGSKELLLGNERYRYDASHYLLVSTGLPLVGHILEASRERPYLAVRFDLDPAIVTAVLMETGHLTSSTDDAVRAMGVSSLDANLLDSMVRLVRLIDAPRDYAALAPLVAREIVYRLALGEQSGRLRQIAIRAGQTHQIAKAIELIRGDYDKPLRIATLARQVGMSISSFHHHFKAVTAMSPLQFQKLLRLHEARRLMLSVDFSAASAAYGVGYHDPSHFSRDYKRLFGEPPRRDIEQLRGAAPDRLKPAR